ncbi:MAG: hypothetical protein ACREID_03870 [Planctomycetota bacterium]
MLWVAAILLAVPETEGARLLRIAWASQYEWKEDAVRNATLDFRYEVTRSGPGDRSEKYAGSAQVVVAEEKIARCHYRGNVEGRRDFLDEHLAWAVGRFVRKPFEAEFEGVAVEEPVSLAGGGAMVRAAPRELLLREGRLVGEDRLVGPDGYRCRVEFATGKVGEGYAVLGEKCSYMIEGAQTTASRDLVVREQDDVPVPHRYEWSLDAPRGVKESVVLTFDRARINLADPVVANPEARDFLKAAWERRYTLPRKIRIQGEFVRKADPALGRWGAERVEGEFQVWGLDSIEVRLDPKTFRDPESVWAKRVHASVLKDLRWVFGLLTPRPFEEEFQGCGFERTGEVVAVHGHAWAQGFRVAEGRLAAHLENGAPEDGWWEHKGRALKDGFLLEKMSRDVEGKPYAQRIDYAKAKGCSIPSRLELFAAAADAPVAVFGVNEYELRKLRVELPK